MPFIVIYRHEVRHCINILYYVVIIVMKESNSKQISKEKIKHINGNEKGSHDMLQSSHGKLFTLVGLLVEPSKYILKPKGSIESSPYIRYPPTTVTSVSPLYHLPHWLLFWKYAEDQ